MQRSHIFTLCRLFCILLVWMNAGYSYAQYEYLNEFEELYGDCIDDEESTIYGGSYQKMPRDTRLPEFPGGGDVQFTRYVHSNIEYPDVIDSVVPSQVPGGEETVYRAKGIVYVQIVIDRCGRATRQEVVQSVNEAYDNEAMRIMQSLPVFRAGAYNGERVKIALVVPVYFTRNRLKPQPQEVDYYDYESDY
ncbi:MAG: energy transducer TonB [Paludibacteraceae bacterium]|nr:energy transducer TonB [Paludibacteraceae bacterium]MBR4840185.1 energy transducer TonB [Paludibacteraceae bacterium]